jgi:hypothetical protein
MSAFFRERMVPKSFGAISPALPPKRQLLESYKPISITERTSSSSAVVRPIYWNPWVAGSIPMGLKFFDIVPFLKHRLLLFLYIFCRQDLLVYLQ